MIGDTRNQFVFSANNFSLSRPYFFRDDSTWCVSRAKRIPIWKNIYYIASLDIIIAGMVLLLVAIGGLYAFTSLEDHPCDIWSSILIAIQVIVLFPCRFSPKRTILRTFFAGGLFAMIATTTTFLAFYYDFILQPRHYKQIDNFDKLVSNNYLLTGDEHMRLYLMEQKLVNRELIPIHFLRHFDDASFIYSSSSLIVIS